MGWGSPPSVDRSKRKTLDQAPVSSNVIGSPWPTLYGTRQLNGTIIAWTNHRVTGGGGGSAGKGGGEVSTGEKHTRTVGLALCSGVVDAITEIMYDDEIIWSGTVRVQDAASVASATVGVGGVVITLLNNRGTATIYFGTATQTQDPVLAQFIADVPYYRGGAYIVFHGDRTGTRGFRLGASDTWNSIYVTATRIAPNAPGLTWTPTISQNPLHSRLNTITNTLALAANAAAFTGLKTTKYQVIIYGAVSATTATADVFCVQGDDANELGIAITNGAAFDIGALGLTGTFTWSGNLAADTASFATFHVLLTTTASSTVHSNPAFVLYELLTSQLHGVALPAALLTATEFGAAAPALAPYGLSFVITDRTEASDLLGGILGDVLAALVVSADGYLQFRRLAGGASVKTLQDNDLAAITRRAGSWSEQPRHVVVRFPDQSRKYRDNTVTVAGVLANSDKTLELESPRTTEATIARLVGARRRITETLPAAPHEVIAMPAAGEVQFGDSITVNAPTRGFDAAKVWSVIRVEAGGDGAITLALVPDIFGGLPTSGITVDPTGGGNGGPAPATPYDPITLQQAFEWPHLFAADQSKRVTLLAQKPNPDAAGFALYSSLDGVDYDLETTAALYHAAGQLLSAVWPRYTMDRQARIVVTAVSDEIQSFSSVSDTDWFARKILALVGTGLSATLYSVRQVIFLGGSQYELRELYGPLGDTRAAVHAVNSPVFIFRIAPLYSIGGQPAWTNGTEVTFKGIPFGARLSPSLAVALEAELTVRDRARRPLPPAEIIANNAGAGAHYADDIVLNWGLRHRPGGIGGQVTPSPFLPGSTDCEITNCELDIYVGGSLKRTLAATVKHDTHTTTIAASPAPTTTEFTVASATGIERGYRLGIVLGGVEYFRRVANVAGAVVTLYRPLPSAPGGGETVNSYEQVAAVYTAAMNIADNGALAATVEVRAWTIVNGLRSLNSADISVTKE